jgi:hypothetical protein
MAIALRQRTDVPADETTAAGNGTVAGDGTAVGTRRVSRTRMARARGASAAGSLLIGIGRLIRLVVLAVVAVIVAGILLRVLGANMSNAVVNDVHDAAKWLVGPFDNIFSISNPKVSIAVNWGLAAVVYLLVGGFIARLFARAGLRSAAAGSATVETV